MLKSLISVLCPRKVIHFSVCTYFSSCKREWWLPRSLYIRDESLVCFSFPFALLSYFVVEAELSAMSFMPASDPGGHICYLIYACCHQVLPLKSLLSISELCKVSSIDSAQCLRMKNTLVTWLRMTEEEKVRCHWVYEEHAVL